MSGRDGGPAFPAVIPLEYSEQQGKSYPNYESAGMTLRDYFAAAAITGLIAQSDKAGRADEFARQAYVVADAMLEERAK